MLACHAFYLCVGGRTKGRRYCGLRQPGTSQRIRSVRSWYFESRELKKAMLLGISLFQKSISKLRADVKMEVGQWQKKSGSARAPPAKMSIAQDFKSRVAAWYKSGMPEGTSFALGETGATLQGLGAIESDIYMNGEKISTILKEHPEMTIREIQRIPEILDDPVLILKSKNQVADDMKT